MAIEPEGKRVAFDAANQIANAMTDGATATILHAPTTRTRETAQELERGLEFALRAHNQANTRVMSPRVENAIRNFHFILDGVEYPPTDAMHSSLPPVAAHNSFLQGFWQAVDDPIAYWLTHASPSAESPSVVAQRLCAFCDLLLANPSPGFFILVTHSGPMRAFLRDALGADPGEPDFCEAFRVSADGVYYREQHGKMIKSAI